MIDLSAISTSAPKGILKSDTLKELNDIKHDLFHLQNQLYADKKRSLLIIFQGVDTAGKDSTIRKVFSGMNPSGVNVKSFKKPSEVESNHDFMWRIYPHFPEKGFVQIFNRSHYEDIIMPQVLGKKVALKKRLEYIKQTEDHLLRHGTSVLKFFLHVSKQEQAIRIKERKTNIKKRYKYSPDDDLAAKKYSHYRDLYNDVLNTSTNSEWKIIQADNKWYRNYLVAKEVRHALMNLIQR
jgi:polyphosphate kinase 2 (PPK2 family)